MISYQLPKVLPTSSGKLSPFMTGCQETNPSTACILFLPRHSQRPKTPGLSIITNMLICQSDPLLYFLSLPSPFSRPSGTTLLTVTRNCTFSLKVLFVWQSSQELFLLQHSQGFFPCTPVPPKQDICVPCSSLQLPNQIFFLLQIRQGLSARSLWAFPLSSSLLESVNRTSLTEDFSSWLGPHQ